MPSPLPSKTISFPNRLVPPFPVATSIRPSPLKSPTATKAVVPSVEVITLDWKVPSPAELQSTSTGTYISGPLMPGNYVVRVQGAGFQTTEIPVSVQVGVITAANVRLRIGQPTEVVQVRESDLVVNTEQASVQGVVTGQQVDFLPINGRNFLDIAQLEPGVQIQDGVNFDPLFWRRRVQARSTAGETPVPLRVKQVKDKRSYSPRIFARCFGNDWGLGIIFPASEPRHGISCCG